MDASNSRQGGPSDAPSDAEAIERARRGDHEAFRVLVERYQARVYRLALRVLRDEERARDASQEAFLKVYRSLDRFEGRSGFYTWLYRLVLNLCLDLRRRDRSDREVPWEDDGRAFAGELGAAREEGSGGTGGSLDAGPLRSLERKEIRKRVAVAIGELPEVQRETLILREVEGLSYAEIAEALGISKGTVMSRLHYARKRVQAALLRDEPDGAGGPDGGRRAAEGASGPVPETGSRGPGAGARGSVGREAVVRRSGEEDR